MEITSRLGRLPNARVLAEQQDPEISRANFEAMIRGAQLPFGADRIAEIYSAWSYVQAMLNRVQELARESAAEPAHIFSPEKIR
jgi:hypothetical protein